MARQPRSEVIDPSKVQILHGTQKCVRGAYLCGDNAATGESFEHRRGWIRERMEFLSKYYGIDCLTFAVLSNHSHVLLRSRPDIVATWSDEEVARRWLWLHPKKRDEDGYPVEPKDKEINLITGDSERVAVLRRRLSDVSWWMKELAENIARLSNEEEQITGRFWQGRFGVQEILDESALLACTMYADLNPVRAAMAESPEKSAYTGAKDRIDDLVARTDGDEISHHDWEHAGSGQRCGWMSPIEIDASQDETGSDPATNGRRASNKGFLSISVTEYLQLLDWTGRAIRVDKRGAIPAELDPILTRLGLDADRWCNVVNRFGKLFKRAAGTAEHLAEEARRRGLQWMQGPGSRLLSPISA